MATLSTPHRSTQRTPIAAERYAYVFERHVTTQKEMVSFFARSSSTRPFQRQRQRQLFHPFARRHVLPQSTPRIAHFRRTPVMPSPEVRVIDFFHRSASSSARLTTAASGCPQLSPLYDPQAEGDYLTQVFHRLDILGHGSFGVVESVESKEDGRKYAVK